MQEHGAVPGAVLGDVLQVVDDLVADEVPGRPDLRLKAERVVHGIVDAVAPHPDVGPPLVGLDAVVGGVEDVVAEDVDVGSRGRDPIGDTGDAVVGDRVVVRATRGERPVQLDPFAVEALAGGVLIPDDRVVRDIPAFPTALEIDVVVIVVEEVPSHDHIGRAIQRERGEGLIPDRQALHPDVAGPKVEAVDEKRLAIARPHPDDVFAGDPRHAEGRSPAVAAGMDEKDVPRPSNGLGRRDPLERFPPGAVTAARPRHHVEAPAAGRQPGQRPRRDRQHPTAIGATVRNAFGVVALAELASAILCVPAVFCLSSSGSESSSRTL